MPVNFVPDPGQWVCFAADLPDGVLDRDRTYRLPPVHKTPDNLYVGIWDPGTNGRRGFIPSGGPVLPQLPSSVQDGDGNAVPSMTATTAPVPGVEVVQHPRIVLVDVEGSDVLHPTVLPDGRLESVRVTFALDEVRDLAAADTDDLPPGRHPDNGRANPIRRPSRQRKE
jgi:hypothetical protein